MFSRSRRFSITPAQVLPTISSSSKRGFSPKETDTQEQSDKGAGALDRSRLLLVAVLTIAQFFSSVCFSCIVPFFPTEATERKGLNTAQVGVIIGGFQLVIFLLCPLIGKNMARLGAHRVFSGGILLSGLCTFVFGLADRLPSGQPFFLGALLIRTLQAVGSGSFSTSVLALVGHFFPSQIAMVTAIIEMANGLGFILGPMLGSFLYEAGGYRLPLFVVGTAQMLLLLLSLPLHWGPMAQDLNHSHSRNCDATGEVASTGIRTPGYFQLLLIPDVFMPLLSLFVVCIAWCFYQPGLAKHMSMFTGWSPSLLVGMMMSLVNIAYLLSAPLWGYLLDRRLARGRSTQIMLFGSCLALVYALLVGPCPLLSLQPSLPLFGVGFTLIGIASACLYIPVFKWCVEAAKAHDFDGESPAVCGLISSFFQSTLSLGSFLGITLGGLCTEKFGFAWTATGVAALELIQMCLQALYYFVKRKPHQDNKIDELWFTAVAIESAKHGQQ